MARTKSIENGVKYTVVLQESDIRQLKELVDKNIINSVNAGVREAVEEYIARNKKETYKKELMKAAKDPEFIKRNDEIMKAFKHADSQTEEMIPEW